MLDEVGKTIVRGMGNRHGASYSTTLNPDDNVFLQHVVVFQRFVARCKEVYVAQSGALQKKFAKGAVIGTVGEAARNDGDELATVLT